MTILKISDAKGPDRGRLDLKNAKAEIDFCVRPILNGQDIPHDGDGPIGFARVENAKVKAIPMTGDPWGVHLSLRSLDDSKGYASVRLSESEAKKLREMIGHAMEMVEETRIKWSKAETDETTESG